MKHKKRRRDFLRLAGLGGLSVMGHGLLTSCNQTEQAKTTNGVASNYAPSVANDKDWSLDPEWQKAKYGDWGANIPSSEGGPMDSVLLKNHAPKSTVITTRTHIPKARYPAIDMHAHDYPTDIKGKKQAARALDDWVTILDDVGVDITVILTTATGDDFDRMADLYLGKYPDKFQLYCGLLEKDIDKPNYPELAVAELERCYELGARGVGELTDKGFGLTKDPTLSPDERLHNHDPRMDPFYQKCAELDVPVVIHMADHPSSWQAPDVYQERTPIFQQFNQYNGKGLSYDQLLENIPKMLKKHPETTFVLCHLANLGNDINRLSQLIDSHPNMYVDISARDYELGRQPRGYANFFSKYADRVLFGTDMGMHQPLYTNWWQLLESADEHLTGRIWWRYYGLDLSDDILKKLYRDNAKRIMNWTPV